jgi:hypothetical protein
MRVVVSKAFTVRLRAGLSTIIPIRLTINNSETGISADFNAVLDTGATMSSISENVVNRLHFPTCGSVRVTSSSGTGLHNVYRVTFILPDAMMFSNITAPIFTSTPSIDVLIGMDIIRQGDLSLTQDTSGNTLVSFRVPSTQDAIDFTKGRAPAALTSAP